MIVEKSISKDFRLTGNFLVVIAFRCMCIVNHEETIFLISDQIEKWLQKNKVVDLVFKFQR
ncbi:MAG: hypothetical protein ACI8QD_001773 [Cyclobacteriaceae bacterium]|jgi:hypothetical protein